MAHNGPVLSIAHSPDGLHLYSWGGTGLLNISTLRMWALNPEGGGCSLSSTPANDDTVAVDKTSCSSQPRPANFGSFCKRSGIGASFRGSPVRMAVSAGLEPGSAWGATAAFVFVPVGPSLLVTAANSNGVFLQRLLKRHFASVSLVSSMVLMKRPLL